MKRIITALLFLGFFISGFAQDLIVKKDGSVIQAKVAKVGTSEVEYKKWSNQDGPTYAIAKSDILAITYQNGEKETFSDVAPTQATPTPQDGPQFIERPVAANNADIIARYNKDREVSPAFKQTSTPSTGGVGLFAFTDESILSNDEMEMSIQISNVSNPTIKSPKYSSCRLYYRYCIILTNKTDKIMYVDLGNCFRTDSKSNDSYCYYTGENVSISKSQSNSVGIGLGGILPFGIGAGIGVGSSTTGGTSRTYSQERILTIAPHSTRKLSDFNLQAVSNYACELVSKGEEYNYKIARSGGLLGAMGAVMSSGSAPSPWGAQNPVNLGLKKGIVYNGQRILYTKDESPISYRYRITYSSNKDFLNYSVLTSEIYMKAIYGIKQTMEGVCINLPGKKSDVDIIQGYDAYSICAPIDFEK